MLIREPPRVSDATLPPYSRKQVFAHPPPYRCGALGVVAVEGNRPVYTGFGLPAKGVTSSMGRSIG